MQKLMWGVFTILFLAAGTASYCQTNKERALSARVELLRNAMIDADSATLSRLTLPQLSYGHSGGVIEDKKTFIEKIVSGKSDFVSIDLSQQTISISGNTAIVRHTLDAVTNNDGKPGDVHLLVLLVWQLHKGQWKLLARQAVKNNK